MQFVDQGHEGTIGVMGLMSSLENDSVAALEDQGKDLWQHIGPRFKDDPNNTNPKNNKNPPIGVNIGTRTPNETSVSILSVEADHVISIE